jgi:hypothetical protein
MVIRVAIRGQSEVAAASRVRDDDEVVSRESYVYSSSFKKVEPRLKNQNDECRRKNRKGSSTRSNDTATGEAAARAGGPAVLGAWRVRT